MQTAPRPSKRISCEAQCIIDHEGIFYHGVIKNVSFSGTLIKLKGTPPDIKPGDTCGLIVCGEPDIPHVLHSCKVIRLDPPHIGLEMLELGCGG